ncbi:hypothetical protein FRC12_001563 [Ceratobasidium sp. 428]|nr:hypothetical protein FRC12_001563 [Ceratobasidium sp. 428]
MRFLALVPIIATISAVSASVTLPKCSKALSVRKEWRDTTDAEKKAFIDAVKCLGNKPHSSNLQPSGATPGIPPMNATSSLYDDFVYTHQDVNVLTHFTGLFFAWHRWLLHTFETALKTECGYNGTLPYWDWSRDTNTGIVQSPIFNSSATHGLGTFGNSSTNYEVKDGAFANVIRAYPNPHTVQRKFDPMPFRAPVFPLPFLYPNLSATDTFTPSVLEAIVSGSVGNYTDFAYKIDGVRAQGMHNAAHLMMGGDMSNPLVSPGDCLFYLHHGNLDCIWARWQKRNIRNQYAIGGGETQDLPHYDDYPVGNSPKVTLLSNLPTTGLSRPVKVIDVIDTENDYLCYKCAY